MPFKRLYPYLKMVISRILLFFLDCQPSIVKILTQNLQQSDDGQIYRCTVHSFYIKYSFNSLVDSIRKMLLLRHSPLVLKLQECTINKKFPLCIQFITIKSIKIRLPIVFHERFCHFRKVHYFCTVIKKSKVNCNLTGGVFVFLTKLDKGLKETSYNYCM